MSRIRTAIVINSRANGEEPDFEEIRPDFCPACGHEVIDDEEYCQFCGEELGSLCRVKETRKSFTSGYGGIPILILVAIIIAYMFLSR